MTCYAIGTKAEQGLETHAGLASDLHTLVPQLGAKIKYHRAPLNQPGIYELGALLHMPPKRAHNLCRAASRRTNRGNGNTNASALHVEQHYTHEHVKHPAAGLAKYAKLYFNMSCGRH